MNERNHEDHEDHEDHEGHKPRIGKTSRQRVSSQLSEKADLVMSQTIGSAIAVHRALGPGFLESIYRKAMCIELESRALAYEKERSICVNYRGVKIPGQRVDFIVEGLVIVEIKAVARLDEIHRAQLISYLKTTGLRGGLLINFRVPILKDGLRRVVV
jgi:GxxExxY protein